MRIEHVKQSNCRREFLKRVHENEAKKKEAKAKGVWVSCKRQVLVFVVKISRVH